MAIYKRTVVSVRKLRTSPYMQILIKKLYYSYRIQNLRVLTMDDGRLSQINLQTLNLILENRLNF